MAVPASGASHWVLEFQQCLINQFFHHRFAAAAGNGDVDAVATAVAHHGSEAKHSLRNIGYNQPDNIGPGGTFSQFVGYMLDYECSDSTQVHIGYISVAVAGGSADSGEYSMDRVGKGAAVANHKGQIFQIRKSGLCVIVNHSNGRCASRRRAACLRLASSRVSFEKYVCENILYMYSTAIAEGCLRSSA